METGSSIDRIFEGKGVKARVKQTSFIAACLMIVALGGFGLNSCGNAQEAEREQIASLIPSNYSVDGVGPSASAHQIGFTGYTFSIATGGTVHQCGGITKEDVLAKKPIDCIDGAVITAKK